MLMPSASEIRIVSNKGDRARHSSLRLCMRMEPFVIRPSPDVRRHDSVWAASGKSTQASEIRRGSRPAKSQLPRRNPEPRDHTGKQRLPWSVPVAIKLYESLNVLLLVCSLEAVRKPFPLISNEPLEASTTVKESAVEIEDHGPDIALASSSTRPQPRAFPFRR